MFGVAKGGWTGVLGREGLFEQAHGGTLFLDEIANLDKDGQRRILKVIETGSFTPSGGGEKDENKVDVRLIFATNKNLKKLVWGERLFMEDLYYRITRGGIIELTPLRKRNKEDLQLITEFLLSDPSKNTERDAVSQLTEEALEWIFEQPLHGNISE